jgi:hypothetical protein
VNRALIFDLIRYLLIMGKANALPGMPAIVRWYEPHHPKAQSRLEQQFQLGDDV